MSAPDPGTTKPGPANPAGGEESPTPPGGPLRQDGAGASEGLVGDAGGGHDDDASGSPAANASAEESGGHTIAMEDEQPDPHPDSGPGATPGEESEQEKNAESSLDQPSGS